MNIGRSQVGLGSRAWFAGYCDQRLINAATGKSLKLAESAYRRKRGQLSKEPHL
jgi:hypothetical protein